MATGTDGEFAQQPEPTFADVMNGFSLDSSRAARRRRRGRRREQPRPVDPGDPAAAQGQPGPAGPREWHPDTEDADGPIPGPSGPPPIEPPQPPMEPPQLDGPDIFGGDTASAVRPYSWTRGRTKSGLDLAIETLVSTSHRGRDQLGFVQLEHRAVAELCEQTRSVAEVAALLKLPLGVARVLLGDMAALGLVVVHQTASSNGDAPDLALMERVLSGLRRL